MTGFGRSSKAMALPSALCKLSSIGQARSAEDRSAAPDCSPACGPVLHHKFLVGARPLPLLAMGSQPKVGEGTLFKIGNYPVAHVFEVKERGYCGKP